MSQPVRVVAGVLPGHEPGEVLAFRRGPLSSHAGRWEFPGGKVDPGETEPEALIRELSEELGIEVQVGAHLWTGARRDGPGLEIAFYEAVVVGGELELRVHDQSHSLHPSSPPSLNWAEVDAAFLGWLTAREAGGSRLPPST